MAHSSVLQHVDDGRPHDEGEAGAHGKKGRDAKHQQAPGNQEPAANAEEAAQSTYNDAQQDEKEGVDRYVGVGEEHSDPLGFQLFLALELKTLGTHRRSSSQNA